MNNKRQRTPRLKNLIDDIPPGFIVDTAWLKARGADSSSIHRYVRQGWLEQVIHGVYRRTLPQNANDDPRLSWPTILLSLQRLMGYNVHLGGRNALNFNGHTHYGWIGEGQRIHLCGDGPSWLKRLPTIDTIVLYKPTLFGGNSMGVVDSTISLKEIGWAVGVSDWPIKVSCPERAILEMIADLRANSDFEHVDLLFEMLRELRPQLLMTLLKACRSIKVRRLFFVYAERHNFDWLKFLAPKQIDFGSGPRVLVPGGKFHSTYHISLPDFIVDTSYVDDCIF